MTDIFDVRVDGALVGLEGHAVQRVQQLGAGENPTRRAGEGREERELAGGERTGSTPAGSRGRT